MTHSDKTVKKGQTLYMDQNHQNAFAELKRYLEKASTLTYPDPNKLYFLYTDASR